MTGTDGISFVGPPASIAQGGNGEYRSGTFVDATPSHMPASSPSGSGTTCVAVGDLDGDEDIVGGPDRLQNFVLRNDGTGRFDSGTLLPRQQLTASLSLGDVDGDGDLDLLAGNAGTRGAQNRLLFNNGAGRFADATPSRLPRGEDDTAAAAWGDVDGDGDLDVVLGNGRSGAWRNRLYLNDGSGTLRDASARRLPTAANATAAVADLDGDGDPDILFGNESGSPLLHNDGTGPFAPAPSGRMPWRCAVSAIATGDLDRDGDLDLVLAPAQ